MMYSTYADLIKPTATRKATAYELVLVVGGVLVLALSARLAVHLPFTPVPVTAQTFAVLLLSAMYGSKRATSTLLAYLAAGAAGLPVFQSGAGGIAYVLASPTSGYLLGFVAAAYLTGYVSERGWDRRYGTAALAMVLGNIMIYLFGLARLAMTVGLPSVLALGFYPFLIGDLLKIALAALILPTGWRLLERLR